MMQEPVLILGDCVERMAEMADACVDLTVTSPPYDNLRTYNNSLNDWTAEKWQAVIRELYRVTKPGGVVVWIVGDATINGSETGSSFRQALYAMDCGFRLHDTMAWHKPDYMPLTHRRYEQAFEFMFIWSKGAPSTFNGIKDKPNVGSGRAVTGTWRDADGRTIKKSGANRKTVAKYGLRSNVWIIGTAKGVKDNSHPATFPEELVRDHILSWSNKYDLVFDPFMGSGTTGIVAIQLGRRFMGVERDPDYMQSAKARVSDAEWADTPEQAAEKRRGLEYMKSILHRWHPGEMDVVEICDGKIVGDKD
jgi:DNA modification methylase